MTVLYAPVADLREILNGTDSGTGTAAQLTDAQLTLALQSASSRISIYAGGIYDSSSPGAVPPDLFHDLALDIAAFLATATYMKSKAIPPTHPVWLRYQAAQQMLADARDGKLRLDAAVVGSVGAESGHVNNRIPDIFTGYDSNTRVSPLTQTLEVDGLLGPYAARPGWDIAADFD